MLAAVLSLATAVLAMVLVLAPLPAPASAMALEGPDSVPWVGTHELWCTWGNPSPYGNCNSYHSYMALDVGMPRGTAIIAAGPGVVVGTANGCTEGAFSCQSGQGNFVAVKHPNGITSRYLHLSSSVVAVNQTVARGELIGYSGATGSVCSNICPHLHYDEVDNYPWAHQVDPGSMLAWQGGQSVTLPQALGYASWGQTPYGTRITNEGAQNPVGNVESLGSSAPGLINLVGWTYDPDTPSVALDVHVYVDGAGAGILKAGDHRPDVGNAFPSAGPNHGFSGVVGAAAGVHEVCVFAINQNAGNNTTLACQQVSVASPLPFGSLDEVSASGAAAIQVRGWTIDPDTAAPIDVHVYIDGAFATATPANLQRPDVGSSFPAYGSAHGYDVTIPTSIGLHEVCVYAINVGNGSSNPLVSCRGVDTGVGSRFHSVAPQRVLDSRNGTGNWAGPLQAGVPQSVTVTGGEVPATAKAVILNVTVTDASAVSFVTAYASGSPVPWASNLNFSAGQTIANLVTVRVGSDGRVAFVNAVGSVNVVADLVGWFDDGSVPGDLFNGLTPTRLLDSRSAIGDWNAPLAAGDSGVRDLQVTGGPANVVPASATSVVLNLTVTNATDASFVQVWPRGLPRPTSSNLNFDAGQTIPNLVTTRLGPDGKVSIFNASGSVDVIVDVVGYFDPSPGGSRFHPLNSARVLDDRFGIGLLGPWTQGQTRSLAVAGASAVPVGSTAVVMNTTVTGASTGSLLTVFPDGVEQPKSSNLNFGPHQTIPNLVVVPLGGNGTLAIYNHLGSVDVIGDVVGYFAPT